MRDLALVLMLAALTSPAISAAAPVTIEFAGIVTVLEDDLSLLTGVELGEPFSGAFTYDDSVIPTSGDPRGPRGGPANTAFYPFGEGSLAVTLAGTTYRFDTASDPPGFLSITLHASSLVDADLYELRWNEPGGSVPAVMRLFFPEGTLVPEPLAGEIFCFSVGGPVICDRPPVTVDPLVVPDLSAVVDPPALSSGLFLIVGSTPYELAIIDGVPQIIGGERSSFFGTLTSLEVPEPYALVLLFLAVGGIVGARTRERTAPEIRG